MADKKYMLELHADLSCERCHKKIKKILSEYREKYHIEEEIFNVKQNTVTISGRFCPKKLAKKLCCKAGGSIKCIKIIEKKPPEPPKKPTKPDPTPPPAAEPPKSKPKPTPPPKEPEPAKPTPPPKAPEPVKPSPPQKEPEPVNPPVQPPVGVCCGPYYQGYGWPPPYYYGCGRPERCCDGYGRPIYNPYISPCCKYFSEEDPSSCTIM